MSIADEIVKYAKANRTIVQGFTSGGKAGDFISVRTSDRLVQAVALSSVPPGNVVIYENNGSFFASSPNAAQIQRHLYQDRRQYQRAKPPEISIPSGTGFWFMGDLNMFQSDFVLGINAFTNSDDIGIFFNSISQSARSNIPNYAGFDIYSGVINEGNLSSFDILETALNATGDDIVFSNFYSQMAENRIWIVASSGAFTDEQLAIVSARAAEAQQSGVAEKLVLISDNNVSADQLFDAISAEYVLSDVDWQSFPSSVPGGVGATTGVGVCRAGGQEYAIGEAFAMRCANPSTLVTRTPDTQIDDADVYAYFELGGFSQPVISLVR